jgi:sugar-specific transcriptional regulator TrmB
MIHEEEKKQEILNKLGFNNSEAKIYLALSKIGPSAVGRIAKTAEVDRGEAYRIIGRLEEKGFLQRIFTFPTKFKVVPIEDLLPNLIQNKRCEIANIEHEARQLLLSKDANNCNETKQAEYIVYIPQAGKSLEEIQREIKSIKKSTHVVRSKKTNQSISQMSGSNYLLLPKLLEKGVEMIHIMNEPFTEKDISKQQRELMRYPNFSLRYLPHAYDCEFIIHDNEKVWVKTCNSIYDKSAWIFSNNPHIVALAEYCFDKMLRDSKPISSKPEMK